MERRIPAFAPDGNVLAVPCESKVLVWNLTGKGKARSLGEKDCAICGCVYSPDGKLLAWGSIDIPKGRSQTIVVCEAASGKVVRKIDVHARIERLRGSPKDNLVAAVLIDDTVEVWDIAKGTRVCVLTNPDEPIHFIAFSPDGEKLATGSKNGHFSVWSVRSGKRLLDIPFVLPAAQSVILDMAFVPSGKCLAAVVLDGDPNAPELVTWSATTGQRMEKTRLAWPCYSLVFSPDGKWVASPAGVTVALRRFPDGTDPLDIQGHSSRFLSWLFFLAVLLCLGDRRAGLFSGTFALPSQSGNCVTTTVTIRPSLARRRLRCFLSGTFWRSPFADAR